MDIIDESEERKPTTSNQIEEDARSRKPVNARVKYASVPYQRPPFYANGHPYGPAPYYYYQLAAGNEKPTPLMFISTQATAGAENPTGGSTTVSPQNLPPRLRQTSVSESDATTQPPATTTTTTTTSASRRHRSILPRPSGNYYSSHPPPPLMATPPGVVFSYPPAVHQAGHIAYNIRTPDELELLAFQQQLMNAPAPQPVFWPPPMSYPPFTPYGPYESDAYVLNHGHSLDSNGSFLNPEAAEWVPIRFGHDDPIRIDDEINFPPLNTHRLDEHGVEQRKSLDAASDADATKNKEATDSPTKAVDSTTNKVSFDQKSAAPSKSSSVTYSTVILQASDGTKSSRTDHGHPPPSRRQPPPSNPVHGSLPPRDRPMKQQRMPATASKEKAARRPTLPTHPSETRNVPGVDTSKPQAQVTDDWIEVKSKKTKKFDRSGNEYPFESTSHASAKLVSEEPTLSKVSPPLSTSSLCSTADNTPTTASTSDDDDEFTNIHDSGLGIAAEVQSVARENDCNQAIIDEIHERLETNERLLIIIRGCPGKYECLNRESDGVVLLFRCW